MSDEVILQYVKSIDERTARMERAFAGALLQHQTADDKKHDELDGRVKSLENSRLTARVGLTTLTLGGVGTGAKLGLIDKFLSMLSSGGGGS